MMKINPEKALSSNSREAQEYLNGVIDSFENEQGKEGCRYKSRQVGREAINLVNPDLNAQGLPFYEKVKLYENSKATQANETNGYSIKTPSGVVVNYNADGSMRLSNGKAVTQDDFNEFKRRFNEEHGQAPKTERNQEPKINRPNPILNSSRNHNTSHSTNQSPNLFDSDLVAQQQREYVGAKGLANLVKNTSDDTKTDKSHQSDKVHSASKSSIDTAKATNPNSANALKLEVPIFKPAEGGLSDEDRKFILDQQAKKKESKTAESEKETSAEKAEREKAEKHEIAHGFRAFLRENADKFAKFLNKRRSQEADNHESTKKSKESKESGANDNSTHERRPKSAAWLNKGVKITDPKLAVEYSDLRRQGDPKALDEFAQKLMRNVGYAVGEGFTIGNEPPKQKTAAERAGELRKSVEADANAEQAKKSLAEMVERVKNHVNEQAKQIAEKMTEKFRQQIAELKAKNDKLIESDKAKRAEIDRQKQLIAELKAENDKLRASNKAKQAEIDGQKQQDADLKNRMETLKMAGLSNELSNYANKWRWNKGNEQQHDVSDDQMHEEFGAATELFDLPHDKAIGLNEQGKAALREYTDYIKLKDAESFSEHDIDKFIKVYNNYRGFLRAADKTLKAMTGTQDGNHSNKPQMSLTEFLERNSYVLTA